MTYFACGEEEDGAAGEDSSVDGMRMAAILAMKVSACQRVSSNEGRPAIATALRGAAPLHPYLSIKRNRFIGYVVRSNNRDGHGYGYGARNDLRRVSDADTKLT